MKEGRQLDIRLNRKIEHVFLIFKRMNNSGFVFVYIRTHCIIYVSSKTIIITQIK